MEKFEYQPGNGTRYDLRYGAIDTNAFLLVWLSRGGSGGQAFRFHGDSCVDTEYLMEKMNLRNEADAVALLMFLASKGHEVYTYGAITQRELKTRGWAI